MIGCTPTHIFPLPFSAEVIKTVEITYTQQGVIKFRKTNADCEIKGNSIILKLTQEDTFKFSETPQVKAQVRILTTEGEVVKSNPIYMEPEECLSKEVLT